MQNESTTERAPYLWRQEGDRWETKQGYVHTKVNGRIIAEHRVVMERMLGRSLLAGENIHHKNGVRNDNRPENLELWVTAPPYGQRVSDIVAHAEDMLRRYAPHRLA